MKRLLILLVSINLAVLGFCQDNDKGPAKQKQVIRLFVMSPDEPNRAEVIQQVEVLFSPALSKNYEVRLVTPDSKDARSRALYDEVTKSQNSRDFDRSSKKRLALPAAEALCIVEITKQTNNEYLFRADIENSSTGLGQTAGFPNGGDYPVKILDNKNLKRACNGLILQLEGGDANDYSNNLKRENNKVNLKAMEWSIIPGVGLMMKGRTGEGVGYLLGDATLIGTGVGILSYANKQKEIMNDRNTTYEAYNKVKSNYNTGKTVSYCCFGAAAAVYVLNLVRSYKTEPKPGEHLERTLIPDLDTSFPWGTNISVNLALTYKF